MERDPGDRRRWQDRHGRVGAGGAVDGSLCVGKAVVATAAAEQRDADAESQATATASLIESDPEAM